MKNLKYHSAMLLFVFTPYFAILIITALVTVLILASNAGYVIQLFVLAAELAGIGFGTRWFVNGLLPKIEHKFQEIFEID